MKNLVLLIILALFSLTSAEIFSQNGCTDPIACNYDSLAAVDDGSCSFGITSTDSYCLHTHNGSCQPPGFDVCDAISNGETLDEFTTGVTLSQILTQDNLVEIKITVSYTQVAGWFQIRLNGQNMHSIWTQEAGCNPTVIYTLTQDQLAGQLTGDDTISMIWWTQSFLATCVVDVISESGTAGCTNPIACNYTANNDCDDGSCILPDGCKDSAACNYNSASSCDDGTCVYAFGCDSCSGETDGTGTIIDGDTDGDGACDLGDPCFGNPNPKDWIDIGLPGFSAGVSIYLSLAFHPTTGEPYLAYRDGANGNSTTVQRFDGNSWQLVGIAGFSGESNYQTIAFNPATNEPYVVFQDVSNGQTTTVMRFDGAAWQVVGSTGFSDGVAKHQHLAFNPVTNEPYVAYRDHANSVRTTMMRFDGTTWQVVGVKGLGIGVHNYQNIAFDLISNEPYVAFRQGPTTDKCTVMRFDGTNWQTVGAAEFSAGQAKHQSLAFHPQSNEPYIAYEDFGNANKATLMRFDGTNWVAVGIPGFSSGAATFERLAFHPTSHEPYVAFSDASLGGQTSVMRFDGTSWQNVGSSGLSPGSSAEQSFAINPMTMELFVAYSDDTNGSKSSVEQYSCAIPGCIDSMACNYDSTAVLDDGSCILPDGCTNSIACNFNSTAVCDDGSCILPDGCTDSASCNFDVSALCDDGSCLTLDACGNCGGTQTTGCTDSNACNYEASASCDDGSCILPDGCTNSTACNYDSLALCDDGSCAFGSIGCTNSAACNYNSAALCDDGSCFLAHANDICENARILSYTSSGNPQPLNFNNTGACINGPIPGCANNNVDIKDVWIRYTAQHDAFAVIIVEGNPSFKPLIAVYNDCTGNQIGCDYETSSFGGYQADIVLGNINCGDTYYVQVGEYYGSTGSFQFRVYESIIDGCSDPQACNFDSCAWGSTTECIYPGCNNPLACNFNPAAGCDDGSCILPNGCTNFAACNYNPSATCNDGSCIYPGCTDETACNFSSTAGCDNGSCEFSSCTGCTLTIACNYDPTALINDGSCLFFDACGVCDGTGTSAGCTNSAACNFNALSDCDNGSCILPDGCTNSIACNYNSAALCDDGSCILPDACGVCGGDNTSCAGCDGIPNSGLVNDACGVCDGDNTSCAGCDGVPNSGLVNDACGVCDGDNTSCAGCDGVPNSGLVNDACGVCDGDNTSCAGCDGVPNSGLTNDVCGVCGGNGTLAGCTDVTASNFNSLADCDDGSCVIPCYNIDIVILTDCYANETSWNVMDAMGIIVAAGPDSPYGNHNTYHELLCLPEGCYDVTIFDVYGDGLAGTTVGCASDGDYMVTSGSGNVLVEMGNPAFGFSVTHNFCILGVLGCTNPIACNYDTLSTYDDGSCILPDGCTNSTACNFNPAAVCDDGSCLTLFGCTDSNACNYDPASGCDDGSCEYASCETFGCTIISACNYWPLADTDDGSCFLPIANCSACNVTSDGLDIIDDDGDGICNANEVPGCMNTNACNFDPTADTPDDDACILGPINDTCEGAIPLENGVFVTVDNNGTCSDGPDPACGQTNIKDLWYSITPTTDCELRITTYLNGSFDDGIDETRIALYDACNGTELACNSGYGGGMVNGESQIVFTPQAGITYFVQAGGWNNFVGTFDLVFTETEQYGCTDPTACNYAGECAIENGSCGYPGCTNPNDCNYDPDATCDDGSCLFSPGSGETTQVCMTPALASCDPDQYLWEFTVQSIIGDFLLSPSYSENLGADIESLTVSTNWLGGCYEPSTMTISMNGALLYAQTRNVCTQSGLETHTFDYSDLTGQLPVDNIIEISFDGYVIHSGIQLIVNYVPTEGPGCTDPLACNYNSEASCDDGSCVSLDVSGICGGTATIVGCTNEAACNYNSAADSDDGSCSFPPQGEFDEYCLFDIGNNCGVMYPMCAPEDNAPFIPAQSFSQNIGANLQNINVLLSWTAPCYTYYPDPESIPDTTVMTISLNGTELFSRIDSTCFCSPLQIHSFDAAVLAAQLPADNILEISFDKPHRNGGLKLEVSRLEIETLVGCMDVDACNYDSGANCEDGSCILPVADCSVCNATNDGLDLIDADGDGVCDGDELLGCADASACNYDMNATDDDGSCTNSGCTQVSACNYDSAAVCDDGNCEFTSCILLGCMAEVACNYDPMATAEDGTCEYTSCAGCTYPGSPEYDSMATIDDGSCSTEGTVCPGDFTGDGFVNVSDLGGFLGAFGTSCE